MGSIFNEGTTGVVFGISVNDGTPVKDGISVIEGIVIAGAEAGSGMVGGMIAPAYGPDVS